jgi:Biopolymer transport protein
MNFRDDSVKKEPLQMFSQASLTDIILLLLIFFLLTSSFVTNFGIKVNVPKAETSVQMEPQQISVAITKEGEFFVDGARVTESALSAAVREAVVAKPNSSLVIQADKEAQMEDAVRVMNIGRALNLAIVIATERGDG